jgi:hypothetical protein
MIWLEEALEDMETVPVNWFRLDTVTLVVPIRPETRVNDAGLEETLKSGGLTVSSTVPRVLTVSRRLA